MQCHIKIYLGGQYELAKNSDVHFVITTYEAKVKCYTTLTSVLFSSRITTELEEMPDQEAANRHAQCLSTKLSALDSEFKSIHFQLIDLIDVEDEGTIEKEQDIMEKHDDDDIDSLTIRVQGLLVASRTISALSDHRLLLRKLAHLEESLTIISDAITTLPPDGLEDLALIQQYQEELTDHKGQLMNLYDGLAGLELEGDELLVLH